MVKKLLFCLSLSVFCVSAFAQMPSSFFSSIRDMPLMPGLLELPDQTVVFDKPQGRIIESVALIESVTQSDIQAFYEQALPQFGWQRLGSNSYIRQNEALEFNVEVIDGQRFLRVMVRPREK